MAQFYFLSILFNIIAGLILIYGRDLTCFDAVESDDNDDLSFDESSAIGDDDFGVSEEAPKVKAADKISDIGLFNNQTFRLVVGILSVFVALMKLLSSMDTPFVGDLLPAVAGFLCGFSLLLEFYIVSSGEDNIPENVKSIFIDSRKYIGIACLAVGVLHFVLPRILFL